MYFVKAEREQARCAGKSARTRQWLYPLFSSRRVL